MHPSLDPKNIVRDVRVDDLEGLKKQEWG